MSNKKDPKDAPVGALMTSPVEMVEISTETLNQLIQSAVLTIGENVRMIQALEIQPGAVIAKQYDR